MGKSNVEKFLSSYDFDSDTPLKLAPIPKGGRWYVIVYGPADERGISAVHSTPLYREHDDAIKDAVTWCRANRPGVAFSIGG